NKNPFCKRIKYQKTETTRLETPLDDFSKFISKFDIKELLMELIDKFKDYLYNIQSKDNIFIKILMQRNIQDLSSIQIVPSPQHVIKIIGTLLSIAMDWGYL
ncbi:hypothetical protein HZS_3834, partial [Henneguya salminicola]